jgi:circadian clock protein KaiC
MLRGGFLPGTSVVIRGAPGTGKTSLAFSFLREGAQRDEVGLFVTFEAFPQALYRDAASLGFDLRSWEDQGLLHIIFTSPEVFIESLRRPDSHIQQLIVERKVRRAAIDSTTHFQRLTADPVELRRIYTTLVNSLHREGMTTLLLSEERRNELRQVGTGGLSFLSDGLIMLRYVEVESEIQRALVVLKLRGSAHDHAIRKYEIRSGGIVVDGVFEGRQGLLSSFSRQE